MFLDLLCQEMKDACKESSLSQCSQRSRCSLCSQCFEDSLTLEGLWQCFEECVVREPKG